MEDAADRWEAGKIRREAKKAEPFVAVDPARYGPDSTVFVVRRGPRLERIESWGKAGTAETVQTIREHLEEVGVELGRFAKHPRAGKVGVSSRVRRMCQRKKWRPGEGDVVVDTVGLGGRVHDRPEELQY